MSFIRINPDSKPAQWARQEAIITTQEPSVGDNHWRAELATLGGSPRSIYILKADALDLLPFQEARKIDPDFKREIDRD